MQANESPPLQAPPFPFSLSQSDTASSFLGGGRMLPGGAERRGGGNSLNQPGRRAPCLAQAAAPKEARAAAGGYRDTPNVLSKACGARGGPEAACTLSLISVLLLEGGGGPEVLSYVTFHVWKECSLVSGRPHRNSSDSGRRHLWVTWGGTPVAWAQGSCGGDTGLGGGDGSGC